MATLDEVIKAYLQLRTQKEELAKKHKEEMAPLNDGMNKCQAWVHQILMSQGQRNTRTDSGSAFLQDDFSVTVEDWPAILSFVREHNLWEFLERRVSKTVISEYIESTKTLPPGLKTSTEISCHIRK
jgi:hypothetical protein